MPADPPPEKPKRSYYFINEIVEDQLRLYIWTGCTDVKLRDLVMSHATELIRQIIRKQRLHTIYPGQDDSAFGDLIQTAWSQIERTLYKFRARPHCRKCYNPDRPNDSLLYNPAELEYGIIQYHELVNRGIGYCPKCKVKLISYPAVVAAQDNYGGSETVLYRGPSKVFNMWSQIARTVILAYIKKEGRDRKNAASYSEYVDRRPKSKDGRVQRFCEEAREICQFNDDYLKIIAVIEELWQTDDHPDSGIISKLVEKTQLPRATIGSFIKMVRARSFEFSDSPISRNSGNLRQDRRGFVNPEAEDG